MKLQVDVKLIYIFSDDILYHIHLLAWTKYIKLLKLHVNIIWV